MFWGQNCYIKWSNNRVFFIIRPKIVVWAPSRLHTCIKSPIGSHVKFRFWTTKLASFGRNNLYKLYIFGKLHVSTIQKLKKNRVFCISKKSYCSQNAMPCISDLSCSHLKQNEPPLNFAHISYLFFSNCYFWLTINKIYIFTCDFWKNNNILNTYMWYVCIYWTYTVFSHRHPW